MLAKEWFDQTGRPDRREGESGQASVEWLGLILVLAGLFALLGSGVGRLEVAGIAHSIHRSLLCAVASADDCPGESRLAMYGSEVESLIRHLVPEIRFGRDPLGMPVDFRVCRSPACAVPATGAEKSGAGEPLTLFTRVIDCRRAARRGVVRCDGPAEGNLYLQIWAYFPESATFRGVPLLSERGHHRHDWESVQFRIEPDGTVSQRASSHAGHNHTRSVGNWPSDAGIDLPPRLDRLLGRESPGGWGPWTGKWLIEGGSHAGNVADGGIPDRYPVRVPGRDAALVPLEGIRGDALVRPARFGPITPPWRKRLWTDPEAVGTG